MYKFLNIAVAIGVSALIATNLFLLFSEKTVIPKSIYVNKYERLTTGDYSEELSKEAFVAPMETYTVYVGSDDAVESWLVTEGDEVYASDELALLNTERADGQRNTWEAERTALLQQEDEVRDLLSDLSSESSKAKSASSSNVDRRNSNVTEVKDKTTIEFGFDFTVDVLQEGSYAQAIAAAEQQLTDISRQLVVVDAQLGQNPARPAVISPVDGVVSNITRLGSTLAVEIFSTQKIITTYAKDNEWKRIEVNDLVLLQADGIGGAEEGTVLSVSAVPMKNDPLLDAYKKLDPEDATNPLAYYEVRISTDAELSTVPFGNNVNAMVITNEALDALSINEKWLRGIDDKREGVIINQSGKALKVPVTTPFTWKTRAVVTEGMYQGDIVVNESNLRNYVGTPEVILPMPAYLPTKAEWRAHGWRNYLRHIVIQ